jgi:hypothetical protein
LAGSDEAAEPVRRHATSWDESSFADMSWHDTHVHGLQIREGAHGTGALSLDLDYIVEWICAPDGTCEFLLAPATLTFRDIYDLRIEIDYAASSAGIVPFSIAGIEREAVPERPDRWMIALNWPAGAIAFRGRGFTQVLRSAPVRSPGQYLEAAERDALDTDRPPGDKAGDEER